MRGALLQQHEIGRIRQTLDVMLASVSRRGRLGRDAANAANAVKGISRQYEPQIRTPMTRCLPASCCRIPARQRAAGIRGAINTAGETLLRADQRYYSTIPNRSRKVDAGANSVRPAFALRCELPASKSAEKC